MLFLGKKNDLHTKKALLFCKKNFYNLKYFLGEWGQPLPRPVLRWRGDFILSYLSRWILPQKVIQSARQMAINFHPGPPEYPGFGCINFALYENAKKYGVTCHLMAKNVDSGKILMTKRFRVFPLDNVKTLLERTYDYQLVTFYEVISKIIQGNKFRAANINWKKKAFTRSDFDKKNFISKKMEKAEIKRRIRAFTFKKWRPEQKI